MREGGKSIPTQNLDTIDFDANGDTIVDLA